MSTGSRTSTIAPAFSTVLKTLLLTDLVGSTELVGSLGDQRAADVFARHDRLARDLLAEFGGREIDKTDGFLFLFDSPSDAVRFALLYQQALANLGEELGVQLASRVGIHVGEVVLRENSSDDIARGAKPVECEGIAKPLTARLMALAGGRQILLTRSAFDLARRSMMRNSSAAEENLRWLAHGPYLVKGVEEPVDVCEVGLDSFSPLSPPQDSEKARRAVAPGDEITLGWRPAAGQEIPTRRNWFLEEKLGEGGFGEVWVASRQKSKEKRLFKFCFSPDRLRGLKREVVLFRLLRETLGEREDITRILDWQFEEPPYFIEGQYTVGGNLGEWYTQNGGRDQIDRARILELIAEVADALGAAHSVGILHKDIKPSNILVYTDPKGIPRIRLTDFGIGLVTDRALLDERGITASGISESVVGGKQGSHSGTLLYMAPELLEGKPASIHSDIYALGVTLYQLLCGDLRRALAPGWERDIDDELLRSDLDLLLDRDPAKRAVSCAEVAKLLRSLEQRRRELEANRQAEAERERLRRLAVKSRRQRIVVIASAALVLVVGMLAAYAIVKARDAERQRNIAELRTAEAEKSALEAKQALATVGGELYYSNVLIASQNIRDGAYGAARNRLMQAEEARRQIEWGFLMRQTRLDLFTLQGHRGPVVSGEFHPDPNSPDVLTVSRDMTARVWDRYTGALRFAIAPEAAGASDEAAQLLAAFRLGTIARYANEGLSASRIVTAFPGSHDIMLWDARTGALARVLKGHAAPVVDIDIRLIDGSAKIVSAGLDGTLRLWDAGTGRAEGKPVEGAGTVASVRFAESDFGAAKRSGERLAIVGCIDGSARIYSLATGEEVRVLRHAPEGAGPRDRVVVQRAEFSGNGLFALTCGSDGRILLWQKSGGGVVPTELSAEGQPLARARISPNGEFIAAALSGNRVAVWRQQRSGDWMQQVLRVHRREINDIRFDNSSSLIATASTDGGVELWDLKGGAMAQRIVLRGHPGAVLGVAISPSADLVLSTSEDGTAKIWDADYSLASRVLADHTAPILSVAFSADGSGYMTTSTDPDRPAAVYAEGGVAYLDGHAAAGVPTGAFSPDGKRVATGSADGWVRTYADWREAAAAGRTAGQPLAPADAVRISEKRINSVEYSPDGSRIAAALEDGRIVLLDAAKLASPLRVIEPSKAIRGQEGRPVLNAHYSPDGKKLVAIVSETASEALGAEEESRAFLWDFESETAVELVLPKGTFRDAAFSPDGKTVATAMGNQTVLLWDAATAAVLKELQGHTGAVTHAEFTVDGRRLFTSSADKTIIIWDAVTGRALVTIEAHNAPINDVAISPDGLHFLTGGEEQLDVLGTRFFAGRLWEAGPWRSADVAQLPGATWDEKFEAWHRQQTGLWIAYRRDFDETKRVLAEGIKDGALQAVSQGADTVRGLSGQFEGLFNLLSTPQK